MRAVTHELKTWPHPFQAILGGTKQHEVRKWDRDFQPGDLVKLREWDPEKQDYTGRSKTFSIGYCTMPGMWGLPDDYGCFTIL